MFHIAGVGSYFLLPDPAAPDDRYAVCLFLSARPGADWVKVDEQDVLGLMRSRSWMEADAVLALSHPPGATS
jgi:hypothetical protein